MRYHENIDVRGTDTPGSAIEVFDHAPFISDERTSRSTHLAEAGLSMAENYLTTTAPTTVGAAWRGINGDPGEERGSGLAVPLLWLAGLLRALVITALYAVALAFATRRRAAGGAVVAGLLVATYFICRALLP